MSGSRVKAVRIHEGLPKVPGEYLFYGKTDEDGKFGLMFSCPCGCGDVGGIRIKVVKGQTEPVWDWDGNEESPTIYPSIRKLSGCEWHGFLRNGFFESC